MQVKRHLCCQVACTNSIHLLQLGWKGNYISTLFHSWWCYLYLVIWIDNQNSTSTYDFDQKNQLKSNMSLDNILFYRFIKRVLSKLTHCVQIIAKLPTSVQLFSLKSEKDVVIHVERHTCTQFFLHISVVMICHGWFVSRLPYHKHR